MTVTLLHLSDVHFGRDAELDQLEAIEDVAPELKPDAVVLSGDLTQRARHGEFQAAHALLRRLAHVAPTLAVPGNHDVQWWKSPFHLGDQGRVRSNARTIQGTVCTPSVIYVAG